MLDDEMSYKLLKLLEENPDISQRQLAEEMGVSLGKVNYCLKALVQVGLIKMSNFARSNNKIGYAYILTPKGLVEKAKVTKRFLAKKLLQYKLLSEEITELKKEVNRTHVHIVPETSENKS